MENSCTFGSDSPPLFRRLLPINRFVFVIAVMTGPEIPKFINNTMLKEIRDRTGWREAFLALGMERARVSREDDWWAHRH